ncbi:MAG: capsular polysaccharide synthesis protein [Lachnospiraceae bacterium]
MNMKRVTHRAIEEIKATAKIGRVTSISGAINTFLAKIDIQRCVRNGQKESPAVRKRLEIKHKVMIQYFDREFADFLTDYDYDRPLVDDDPQYHDCIWMCWWQGIENAPEIVKKCIDSVRQNAGTHRLIVITEDNYKEYANIPQWFIDKRNAGIISKTHFADLLRLTLLAEHGGMWLDATFFCTSQVIEDYFNYPLWSIKRPDYLHLSIASGYFATYALKCSYEYRWIFATIRDFFLHYWQTNDSLIDYLTLDYMIALAQIKDSRIQTAFKNIVPNNPDCEELQNVLGEPYDVDVWKEMKKNTSLFKLTWKLEYPRSKNNKDTFYSYLLNGKL